MIPKCFICDSPSICEHREWELVEIWRSALAENPPAPVIKYVDVPVVKYVEIPVIKYVAVESKPLKVEPIQASGYRLAVSREDALRRRA